MLSTKVHVAHIIITLATIVTIGVLGFVENRTQKEINMLKSQPVMVEQKIVVTPTATPSATPTIKGVYYAPTKVFTK